MTIAETTTTTTSTEVERRLRAALDERADDLIALSHAIGADPETAFAEHRAAARVGDVLRDAGFDVQVGAFGLDTAVEAVYGSGEVTVAVAAEYDALPLVGHACGHNMIAAAGVGAALGLRAVADDLGIRVKLLGTPAEELGGGKILMLQQGAWDDATFSLMVHGGPGAQYTCSMASMALELIVVEFTGRAAHAAAAPHEGVNAGDAATLTQVAIGLLRQQLRAGSVVSSFIAAAGESTNVIPGRAVMEIEIRALDAADWAFARRRVRECIEGAARATGCTFEIETPELPYEALVQDARLAGLWDDALRGEGYDVQPMPAGQGGGSTDMGNVSRYLPSIHPMIAVLESTAVPHHPDFAAAAVSPAGDRAVLDGALGLALTAARAASDPVVRAELLAEQAARAPFPRP